jgi:hypothetical protein
MKISVCAVTTQYQAHFFSTPIQIESFDGDEFAGTGFGLAFANGLLSRVTVGPDLGGSPPALVSFRYCPISPHLSTAELIRLAEPVSIPLSLIIREPSTTRKRSQFWGGTGVFTGASGSTTALGLSVPGFALPRPLIVHLFPTVTSPVTGPEAQAHKGAFIVMKLLIASENVG